MQLLGLENEEYAKSDLAPSAKTPVHAPPGETSVPSVTNPRTQPQIPRFAIRFPILSKKIRAVRT